MAINKILVRPEAAADVSGEWAGMQINSATGAFTYVSPTDTVIPGRQISQVVKVPLSGTTIHAASGGVVAWQIPEAGSILIDRVVLDVTTVATAACTLDIGYTVTSAATSSDTLLDGVDVNAATAVFDSMNAALDSGANAKSQKGAAGKWITIDEKTGDATGLVANLYIYYTAI